MGAQICFKWVLCGRHSGMALSLVNQQWTKELQRFHVGCVWVSGGLKEILTSIGLKGKKKGKKGEERGKGWRKREGEERVG